jgi:shikimate kinase
MTSAAQKPRRVILVGMMGSGKTTVGALLAERTGWPFHDNDTLLRELFGASPREVLLAGDEDSLLAAEVAALEAGLARPEPSIVAAAGGTIRDASARDRMRATGLVVWLRVTAETSLHRSAEAEHRPWPDPDHARWIARATQEREASYRSVADLALDADQASPTELTDQILAHLVRRPGWVRQG